MSQSEKLWNDSQPIYWITTDRFDTKPDKTSWTEIASELTAAGASVNIITAYRHAPYSPENSSVEMTYLKPVDVPLIYRLTFLWQAYRWLHGNADRNGIIIVNQDALFLLPHLRRCGFTRIHLDIRTLPVAARNAKDRLDNWLFWDIVMKRYGAAADSYSFITRRLLEAVQEEFGHRYDDYCLWSSGVTMAPFDAARKPPSLGSDNITLFYHGSIYESRGVNTVVTALELMPQELLSRLEYVVVGGGTGLESLKLTVEQSSVGEQVNIKGLVPYENVPREIAAADLCICPLPDLLEWNVSSPIKVLEYLASGKPMVLTAIPAHTDVLDYDTTEFVSWADKTGNAVALANAITDAIPRLKKMSEAAHEKGPEIARAHWTWQSLGRKFAHFLAER